MAATGGSLLHRVRRLIGAPSHAGRAPGWLAGAAAVLAPVAPAAAQGAAWLNGWCAAYLAGCARLVAAVPFAQAHGAAAGVAALGGVAATAYAWLRWRRS